MAPPSQRAVSRGLFLAGALLSALPAGAHPDERGLVGAPFAQPNPAAPPVAAAQAGQVGFGQLGAAPAAGDAAPASAQAGPELLPAPALAAGLAPEFLCTSEVCWALFNFVLGGVIFAFLSRRADDGTDMSFVWFRVPMHVAEGVAFLISAANMLKMSPLLDTLFLVVQNLGHVPFLWARNYYLFAHDRPKDPEALVQTILPIGAIVATVLAYLHGTDAQSLLAMPVFELPGIVGLCVGLGFAVASVTRTCRQPSLPGEAWVWVLVNFAFYGVHLWHMILKFGAPETNTPAKEITRSLLASVLFTAMFCMDVRLSACRAFHAADTEGSPWTNPMLIPGDRGAQHPDVVRRFAASSDRFWSCAFVFSLVAYSITGTFVRLGYTDFAWGTDRILHMYHTFHPCILLDYLPGTLFAQPLYDLQIYMVNVGMILGLAKKVLEGGLPRICMGAMAYTIFLLTSGFFQLVFTLNPTSVSVLWHSLPFMVFQIGCGMFLYSELFSTMQNHDLTFVGMFRKNPLFFVYCLFLIIVCFEAVRFMAEKLVQNPDVAMNKVSPLERPLDIQMNWSGLILAWVQEPLYLAWFWISPRADVGISFDVHFRDLSAEDDEEAKQANRMLENRKSAIDFKLDVVHLLRLALFLAACTFGMAGWSNYLVHGDVSMDWRAQLVTLPGAAVVAVGWVVVVMVLSTYALLSCYSEIAFNRSPCQRTLLFTSTILLVVASLCAHGGTIPKASEYFHGARYFAAALVLFVLANSLISLMNIDSHRPMRVTLELLAALLVVGAAGAIIVARTKFGDLGLLCAVFVWSLASPVKPQLVFTGFRLEPMPRSCLPWPLAWEVHGAAKFEPIPHDFAA